MPSNNSRRRHSKQPSTTSSKKSAPSVISTTSLDSASNNAAANKYSIFPSSLRPSKRPDAKKGETDTPELRHSRSKSINDPNRENVDVFAYMMEEGEEEEEEEEEEEQYESGAMEEKAAEQHAEAAQAGLSSSSSSAGLAEISPKSPRYSDLEVRAIQDGVQRTWARASLHSDSGISVRSSSPDQDSPIMQHKLPTVFDESLTEAITEIDGPHEYSGTYGLEISPDPVDPCSAFDHKHWPSMETNNNFGPEAYYAPPPSRLSQAVHSDSNQMPDLCPMPVDHLMKQVSRPERPQARTSNSGYEFLASNIDSRDDALLKPIYRKFEMLNNRMLLYLQDEIAEMEDQLRELDDAIANEQEPSGLGPASRRIEAKLPSQLHWHRVDLLHRSFAKVEQYSKLPSSLPQTTPYLSLCAHRPSPCLLQQPKSHSLSGPPNLHRRLPRLAN